MLASLLGAEGTSRPHSSLTSHILACTSEGGACVRAAMRMWLAVHSCTRKPDRPGRRGKESTTWEKREAQFADGS